MNGTRSTPVRPPRFPTPPPRTVTVALPGAPYTVHIGEGLLSRLDALALKVLPRKPSQAFLCFDVNIPDPLVAEARQALDAAGLAVTAEPLGGGEAAKTLATVERLLRRMAHARLERWDPVVVLGGGVAGDAGGFAAAIYRRGVPVIQCPSTLLSMVDASVGGKTGVNLALGPTKGVRKNLVGAFHHPLAVLADTRLLASLPDRQFRCGLAECVKHAMIAGHAADPGLFEWTERNTTAIVARSPEPLAELIARNVAVKARIVESDPREEAQPRDGGRALLNLGHTFGHALEPIPALSPTGRPEDAPLEHGEAVALGLWAAARCALGLQLCTPEVLDRLSKLLSAFGLPQAVTGLPPSSSLLDAMLDDKKTSGGKLRLVLPTGLGTARVVEAPQDKAVVTALDALRGVFTPD